jgi:hypothetical protein
MSSENVVKKLGHFQGSKMTALGTTQNIQGTLTSMGLSGNM